MFCFLFHLLNIFMGVVDGDDRCVSVYSFTINTFCKLESFDSQVQFRDSCIEI